MQLTCLEPFTYGSTARLTPKQAKDSDLDPKDYKGNPVQVFEPGTVYDLPDALGARLLRDYGPAKNRPKPAFEAVDERYARSVMERGADGVPLNEVLERGYVTPDEEAQPVAKDVSA